MLDGVGGKDLRPVAEEFKKQLARRRDRLRRRQRRQGRGRRGRHRRARRPLQRRRLAKAAVAAMGGQGAGGKPDFAQGGAPDATKADEGLAAIKAAIGG